MAVAWKTCFSGESMPAGAVVVGYDTDRDPIYVGQAKHVGHLLPAKVIPNKQCAYVSYDGEEFQKGSFNVLCCRNASWVEAPDGKILPNAIPGGHSSSGVKLYIGRARFNGSLTPGKVFRNDSKLYIAYGNCEVLIKQFEILVIDLN